MRQSLEASVAVANLHHLYAVPEPAVHFDAKQDSDPASHVTKFS